MSDDLKLNLEQKGVYGLQEAFNRVEKNPTRSNTFDQDGNRMYIYNNKDIKDSGLFILAYKNDNTPSVKYSYVLPYENDGQTMLTTVEAFDDDGDGNIDKFTYQNKEGNCMTYVNKKDDGEDNFINEENYKPKYKWYDPRGWF